MGQVSSGDRGIGLLTSQFPTASHQRGQGTRGFTKTLEVTVPPLGPASGKTVSVQDPAASLPTLHTILCIAGSPNLHCTVHFLPLLQPQFGFILNPRFHVSRGTNICGYPLGAIRWGVGEEGVDKQDRASLRPTGSSATPGHPSQ